MESEKVSEVIYEALEMYIDEISLIDSVEQIPRNSSKEDPRLKITLKNGEEYRIIIVPTIVRLNT